VSWEVECKRQKQETVLFQNVSDSDIEINNAHTIYWARHRQQIFFGDVIPVEISANIPIWHGFLVDTEDAVFPPFSLPLQPSACQLDHCVSFDILDVESPLGNSAFELLLSK
jgi:hypothetical protein